MRLRVSSGKYVFRNTLVSVIGPNPAHSRPFDDWKSCCKSVRRKFMALFDRLRYIQMPGSIEIQVIQLMRHWTEFMAIRCTLEKLQQQSSSSSPRVK